MQVRDVMTKSLISVKPDETISHALSQMEKHKIHQLPVMSNGTLYGMLELKKIVTRNIDISSSKVENFATNIPNIDANASAESAAQLLLSSALRAVPVTDGGRIVGVVSESDLMKVAKQFVRALNQPIEQIATEALCADRSANYGHVKSIIFEKNVSRVPLVDSGKVIGIVSTLEMIKVLRGKETMEVRGGTQEKAAREKLRLEETPAAAIMRQPTVVQGTKTIGDTIELLRKNEEVIVQNGRIKIVTHKDILELFVQPPKKGVYVQITGMQDEGIEFKAKMDIAVTDFVKKMAKIVGDIEYLVVHIEKMHKQGPKEKYSIRARFKAPLGFFTAHSWGWKPINVLQETFDDLGREVLHKYGKVRTDAKKRRMIRKGR